MEKRDTNWLINQLKDTEYSVVDDYITGDDKIQFKHNCGFIFKCTPRALIGKEAVCPVCYVSKNQTTESFKEKVKRAYNDEYEVLGEYITGKTKILIKHKSCGREYEVYPQKFLAGSNLCFCKSRQPKLPTSKKVVVNKEEKSEPKEKLKGYALPYDKTISGTHLYDLDGRGKNFVNTQNRIEDVKNINNTFNEENPIPKYKSVGISFSEFMNEIKSKITVEENKKVGDSTIQYYFPDKNIGVNYYTMAEASETLGKKKKGWMIKIYNDCMENKDENGEAKPIHIIQCVEEEWEERKEILKSKILHQVGLQPTKIIFARKCEVREINAETKEKFCEENHIQHGDSSKVRLGLFYQDELIAVQTYGAKRLCLGIKDQGRKPNEYELLRFCVRLDITCTGAFGKLQKYFIKNYKPTRIETFADKRWSWTVSSIYRNNGYKYDHETESSYYYFNYAKGEIHKIHRFGLRKQEALKRFSPNCSENLGEYENCFYNGYERFFDCGNILFILEPENETN